jgi:hypothetical protein
MANLMSEEISPIKGWEELVNSGVVWAINRAVFHPRGFALAIHTNDAGDFIGWTLKGDGRAPYIFTDKMFEIEMERFKAFERLLFDNFIAT